MHLAGLPLNHYRVLSLGLLERHQQLEKSRQDLILACLVVVLQKGSVRLRPLLDRLSKGLRQGLS